MAEWPHPLAITDHSAHIVLAPEMRGQFDSDAAPQALTEDRAGARDRVLRYLEGIRSLCGDRVLLGTELDILPDGRPVFPEDLLPGLDVVVGAIHALAAVRHGAPLAAIREEWMAQNLALMRVGAHIIAHPFRYLVHRQIPVGDADVDWIVREAAAHQVALELNSHYLCRELDDLMMSACLARGVRVAIGTDAHRWNEMADFGYHQAVLVAHGVDTADRRAAVLFGAA